MDFRCHRARALAIVFFLTGCLPSFAETFLVIVTETQDGETVVPPFAAREGILAALFEDGQIAFDLPEGGTPHSLDDLPRLGIQAGADIAAVVVVDWHEERLDGDTIRVSPGEPSY